MTNPMTMTTKYEYKTDGRTREEQLRDRSLDDLVKHALGIEQTMGQLMMSESRVRELLQVALQEADREDPIEMGRAIHAVMETALQYTDAAWQAQPDVANAFHAWLLKIRLKHLTSAPKQVEPGVWSITFAHGTPTAQVMGLASAFITRAEFNSLIVTKSAIDFEKLSITWHIKPVPEDTTEEQE